MLKYAKRHQKEETISNVRAVVAVLSAALLLTSVLIPLAADAEQPSAFGGDFDLQDFYRPFTLQDITPQNMQKWPYNKHVSANWDKYVTTSTTTIKSANTPKKLEQGDKQLDLNSQFKDGKSYLQSLLDTQVTGFIVLKPARSSPNTMTMALTFVRPTYCNQLPKHLRVS